MIGTVSVTIGTVVKRVTEVLLSNEKGRKFLAYTLGIILFIVLVPLITLFGFFGWMSGDGGTLVDQDFVLNSLPIEQQVNIEHINNVCDTIVSVFKTHGLDTADQRKASAIYIGYLIGMESNENFYNDLVYCFLNTNTEQCVYDLFMSMFNINITIEDQAKLDEMYGETPTRITDNS